MAGPLEGRRIVVPESRELDLFARMLEEQGATTLRCPMVRIIDLDDPAPVLAWLRHLIDGPMDDLVLLTGEGLRRILKIARAAGRESEAVAALGRVRTITRGPKPARALREIGLAPSLAAVKPTTEGVIETLAGQTLHGRRVGVQLYPGNPNALLLDFLRQAGATPDPLLPYQYASDAATSQVETAIREMAEGRIDAVAFTSAPQVRRLREVARDRGLEAELAQGMRRTNVAAVGPVVAAAIEAMGAHVAIAPLAFHMKPLVSAICASLGPSPPGG